MGPATEGFEVGQATALRDSGKALLVDVDGVGECWIPHSCIHDNSEVYDSDHTGNLVVKNWWARKQGWE